MKPPFGGAEHVLAYLAAYTHRIAISNRVSSPSTARTSPSPGATYADVNEQKTISLPAGEFLRRFAMHIVPPRFTRIRYYGFLANCVRGASLEWARLRPTQLFPAS